MNFERGKEPKEALGLGWREVFKSMKSHGWLLFEEKDIYQNINNQYYDIEGVSVHNIKSTRKYLYSATLIILVIKDKFKILKNRYGSDPYIGKIEDLPQMIFDLKTIADHQWKHRHDQWDLIKDKLSKS